MNQVTFTLVRFSILEDGTVGESEIALGSGNRRADDAAVRFTLEVVLNDAGLVVDTPTGSAAPVAAAVVADDHRVHYRELKIADDDGQTVRLLDGLRPGETVALDLGDSVEEGGPVQVVAPTPAARR